MSLTSRTEITAASDEDTETYRASEPPDSRLVQGLGIVHHPLKAGGQPCLVCSMHCDVESGSMEA